MENGMLTQSQPNSKISKQSQKLSKQFKTEVPNEIVEEQTKKVPNLVFLGLAAGAIVASGMLAMKPRQRTLATFVGLWVPSILIFGLYNKMVKVEDEVLSETKQIKELH